MPNRSIHAETLRAAGAVVAARLVGFDGAQATVAGQKVLGPAQYAAADGELVAVDAIGTSMVEAGAAIAVGDDLIADAQGRAVPAAGGAGEYVFADALQAATGAGQRIEAILRR